MKFYLIIYTSRDDWEMSPGIAIVCADSRSQAKKIFCKECSYEIKNVVLLKPKKDRVLFNQGPTIQ